jgi:hypothetical protein
VPSGQTANLTLVHVAACSGGGNQKWRQGNFGSLINQASGRCLDLPEADFTNGRQLQIYDCVGTRNQSWVGPDYTPASGALTWGTTSSCADRDVVTNKVQIWTCTGLGNQTWTLHANGTFTSGGTCLQPASSANGAGVTTAPCTANNPGQQWTRWSNGQLRNVTADRCLDLDSGNTTNGRQLSIWDCVGGPNQTWTGPT